MKDQNTYEHEGPPSSREFPLNEGTMILLTQDFLKANPDTELFCLRRGQDGQWPLCVNDKGGLCYRDGNSRRPVEVGGDCMLNEASFQSVEDFLRQQEIQNLPVSRFGGVNLDFLSQPEESEVNKHAELLKTLETGYDEMVDTLKEFGYNQSVLSKVPSKDTVLRNIQKLRPAMLEKISKFGKPTLLITPEDSYKEKLKAINDIKKLPGQDDNWYGPDLQDEIWNTVPDSGKMVVSIVDGQNAMPKPATFTGEMTIDEKMTWYEQEYEKEGMEVMDSHEGAMLLMLSAKNQQPIDDMCITDTVTYYSRKGLIKDSGVLCSCWDSGVLSFSFDWADPEDQHASLRSRPSVQVMRL